jgi:hypothetical protein
MLRCVKQQIAEHTIAFLHYCPFCRLANGLDDGAFEPACIPVVPIVENVLSCPGMAPAAALGKENGPLFVGELDTCGLVGSYTNDDGKRKNAT